MTDAKLLARFEAADIPHDEWDHEAHISAAAAYVATLGPGAALVAMRVGVKKLNAAHGVPTTDTQGYHETLTRAWVSLVAAARRVSESTLRTDVLRLLLCH